MERIFQASFVFRPNLLIQRNGGVYENLAYIAALRKMGTRADCEEYQELERKVIEIKERETERLSVYAQCEKLADLINIPVKNYQG